MPVYYRVTTATKGAEGGAHCGTQFSHSLESVIEMTRGRFFRLRRTTLICPRFYDVFQNFESNREKRKKYERDTEQWFLKYKNSSIVKTCMGIKAEQNCVPSNVSQRNDEITKYDIF